MDKNNSYSEEKRKIYEYKCGFFKNALLEKERAIVQKVFIEGKPFSCRFLLIS